MCGGEKTREKKRKETYGWMEKYNNNIKNKK